MEIEYNNENNINDSYYSTMKIINKENNDNLNLNLVLYQLKI